MARDKGETVLALVAALVVVAALAAAIAWQGGLLWDKGQDGPEVTAFGQIWQTTYFEGEGDHNTYAIWTHLEAPEGTDLSALPMDGAMWASLCEAVLAQAAAFVPEGVDPRGMDHVDLNLVVGGQKALIHDITVLISDGACIERFYFERLEAGEEIFSAHSVDDHVAALIYAWGMEQTGLTYKNSNGDRSIEVDYDVLSSFGRDPQEVNLLALCVLTLANINKEVNLYVLKINPANYPVMKISLVTKSGAGLVSFSRGYGSGTITLKDGTCQAGTDV